MIKTKIVISLDTNFFLAKKVVDICIKNGFNLFKVGHLLFDTEQKILDYITKKGGKVILDLKFFDIPSVISKAVEEILKIHKIFAFTVHTLGGKQMLKEVVQTVKKTSKETKIFGVTVLTSLDSSDIKELGFKTNSVETQVKLLAKFAKKNGLDGIVCSPREVKIIKNIYGKNFLTLVPGVSIEKTNSLDQKRTLLLKDMIEYGADYVVIGRAVYESKDIDCALKKIRFFISKTD
ncbi:MAG: orotidine-5'-phosphate decarboxylase [Endomicrobiia bacterium]